MAASPHSFLIPLFSLLTLEGGVPKGGSWLSKRDEVVGSTVFPVIPLLTSFLDRKRKRFLAFARNDDAGVCPEGAEVGSRSGIFTRRDAKPASLRSSAPSRGRGENDP